MTTTELDYPFQDLPEFGRPHEVAPGIRWLRMPMPGSLAHINLWLLEDRDGWTVVDTGLANVQVHELWEQVFEQELEGRPVTQVLCTHMHPDHIGQAGLITERFRCSLLMSRAEYFQARAFAGGGHFASWQSEAFYRDHGMPEDALATLLAHGRRRRSPGDGNTGADAYRPPLLPQGYRRLRDGDVLTIGDRDWRVLVGSGHSPEHVCLYCRASGILISGDQVLPMITSNVSVHAVEAGANPLKEWLDSHDRFLDLPDETLVLPAHNTPFRGLRRRLRGLIEHHEDRLLMLEEHCAEPRCAHDLLPVLFKRELDPWQRMMALGECIAHLHLLVHQSRMVRERSEAGHWVFRSIDPTLARRARPGRHDEADEEPNWV